jgi:hypothetical protein
MSGLHPYAGGKTSLAFKKDGNKIDSGQGALPGFVLHAQHHHFIIQAVA